MPKKWSEYGKLITKTVTEHNEIVQLAALKGHSIIFIVDMVKGFCQEGQLSTPAVNNIVQPIKKLAQKAIANNIKLIAFNDAHNEHSPEFQVYPPHCLENTSEAEMVDDLNFFELKIIKKNSTNGFFAFDFKPNLQWDIIIIVGCCTDICVYQLAISCQTWFNQHNKIVNIYVPKKLVATFDNEAHPKELINAFSFFTLIKNGVKVVEDII